MNQNSDMWDKILLRVPEAMKMVQELVLPTVLDQSDIYIQLENKFRRGDETHNGEWKDWAPEKFVENIKEEIYDMIIYCAMDLARLEETRKYGKLGASYNQAKMSACEEKRTDTAKHE